MKSVTKLAVASATAAALAGPALAGDIQATPAEPVVVAPVPVQTYGGDWTGGYFGLNLGNINVDTNVAGVDGDDFSYGVHGGYDYDFGRFVLGGEVEFDATDIDLAGAATVDSVARLKLRGGYDLGRTLLYVTGGAAEVDTSLGSDTGGFAGIGVTYMVTDRFYVGGEVLGHQFDDINGTGIDADATSVSVRGGVRF